MYINLVFLASTVSLILPQTNIFYTAATKGNEASFQSINIFDFIILTKNTDRQLYYSLIMKISSNFEKTITNFFSNVKKDNFLPFLCIK